ncbi:hypothetical protein KIN34_12110 [Cellulomonas sp. DKR-3]|uniref:Secreted protein n=1 Tax=Cellulomonas fulva TaxID=2835530 RepID=A0ABS5U0W8_9CELL|nr:hypothetical protein [Cellulomonas fulva]MBT0995025.1 hypothetical protein [Cellulomonas fulva]
MRRLFWVGVGVVATVVVVRKGRDLAVAYLPEGTTDVVEGATAITRALGTARHEFVAGMAEREAQLRHQLVGDVDVDEARANQGRHVEELRAAWSGRRGGTPVPGGWAGPLDDPDDDGEAAFF